MEAVAVQVVAALGILITAVFSGDALTAVRRRRKMLSLLAEIRTELLSEPTPSAMQAPGPPVGTPSTGAPATGTPAGAATGTPAGAANSSTRWWHWQVTSSTAAASAVQPLKEARDKIEVMLAREATALEVLTNPVARSRRLTSALAAIAIIAAVGTPVVRSAWETGSVFYNSVSYAGALLMFVAAIRLMGVLWDNIVLRARTAKKAGPQAGFVKWGQIAGFAAILVVVPVLFGTMGLLYTSETPFGDAVLVKDDPSGS